MTGKKSKGAKTSSTGRQVIHLPDALSDEEKPRLTILVMDNDQSALTTISETLAISGYNVASFSAAHDAISWLESGHSPHMIIANVFIPWANGFEFYRKIAQLRDLKEKPFVFLTAPSPLEDILRAMMMGADDYITKPPDPSSLVENVNKLFRQKGLIEGDGSEHATAPPNEGLFKGSHIIEILQVFGMSDASGILSVKDNDGARGGNIWIEGGKILSACSCDEDGYRGLISILKIQDGSYNFIPGARLENVNIGKDTKEAIIDSLQIMLEDRKRGVTINANNYVKERALNKGIDLNEPVEIAKDTYWVGFRNKNVVFHSNQYLRVFKGGTSGNVNLLIDPGSPVDFNNVTKKVGKVIGSIGNVHMVTINHPDPDVGMSAGYLSKINPKMMVITTLDNWRLVSHFDIKATRFRNIKDYNYKLRVPTGHVLKCVLTPHCHFRGAFAVYDLETRVLFTGDLLGGVTDVDLIGLYATEKNWEGIKMFHQIYFPSGRAIKSAIDKIRALNPKPELIVPQHGGIIAGELMDEFLNRLYDLPVGMDTIPADNPDQQNALVVQNSMANEIVRDASAIISKEAVVGRLAEEGNDGLGELLTIKRGGKAEVLRLGTDEDLLTLIYQRLVEGEAEDKADLVQAAIMKICANHHVAAPKMNWRAGKAPASEDEMLTSAK